MIFQGHKNVQHLSYRGENTEGKWWRAWQLCSYTVRDGDPKSIRQCNTDPIQSFFFLNFSDIFLSKFKIFHGRITPKRLSINRANVLWWQMMKVVIEIRKVPKKFYLFNTLDGNWSYQKVGRESRLLFHYLFIFGFLFSSSSCLCNVFNLAKYTWCLRKKSDCFSYHLKLGEKCHI